MPGWNHFTEDAVEAAKKVARKPWFQDLLDMVISEQKLGFAVSAEAMARLLDIAMLTGNQEAATTLSSKCTLLPLRGWYSSLFFRRNWGDIERLDVFETHILRAALAAGTNFNELVLRSSKRFNPHDDPWVDYHDPWADDFPLVIYRQIPFSQALFLLSTSLWMELGCFLRPRPWQPEHHNYLGEFFLYESGEQTGPFFGFKLDTDKLQKSCTAEVDLRCVRMEFSERRCLASPF